MTRLAAVLIGGPPATGKTTLATALAPHLGAAVLDLDVATGPLVRVVSDLTGVHDLDDPVLAGLTRDARYEALLGLAEANMRAGRPVVLVAPFSAERARPSAWAATAQRIPGDATMIWLHLPPQPPRRPSHPAAPATPPHSLAIDGIMRPDLVAEALAVCEGIIRDCRATGVPVVIENLVYARPGEELRGQAREDAIIEAARALNDLDIDLLKLEYPGSPAGCRRLAATLGRPWAVLSAGVPFDQFTDIIRIAADEGGAAGFIAGRSVWREVVGLTGRPREEFLTSVALPRLEKLVDVAAVRARPWTEVSRPALANREDRAG